MNALIVININLGVLTQSCPWCCDGALEVLENIKKSAKDYTHLFIINDQRYDFDQEWSHTPKRFLRNSQDTFRLHDWEKSLNHNIIYLEKRTLNAVANTHNLNVIVGYGFKEITVGGFVTHLDVVNSAIGLMDAKQKTVVNPDLCGDLTSEKKNWAIDYLKWLNLCQS